MIAERLASKPGLLRVASPSTRNNATNEDLSNEARNSHATAAQQPSLKALAILALSRNSHATNTQQVPKLDRKTTQQTVAVDRGFVAQESNLLRVASVAFPRGATAQQAATLTRTIVKFRLPGGCPRSNCTAIGTKPREEIIAELRRLHGDVVEVLP